MLNIKKELIFLNRYLNVPNCEKLKEESVPCGSGFSPAVCMCLPLSLATSEGSLLAAAGRT